MNSSQKPVRFILLAPLALSFSAVSQVHAQTLPYQDPKAPTSIRLDDLMGRLTLDEKLVLLNGTWMSIREVPRLGIPPVRMADAGQGVRGGEPGTLGPATAFPAAVAMAASWNQGLVSRVGEAIGVETKNKGIGTNILLGPAVNIQRSPLGGRNGEYFSEDPFLSAHLGVSYIDGMQKTGTLACIKHFAVNNEEVDRAFIDAQLSERALREIYLPSFEAAVKDADVAAVMSAYNRVSGPHASASRYLLTDVLKRGWGFKGIVMSDWGGIHGVAQPIKAGNDIEMPGPGMITPANVKAALERGQVTVADIDANVRRLMLTMFRSGVLDNPAKPNSALVNSDAHREVALQAALEGTVLLKNERGILPLDAAKIKSIALIGPAANGLQIGATGSPTVTPVHLVKPFEAIKARVGAGVTVTANTADLKPEPFAAGLLTVPQTGEAGFKAEYFANRNLQGAPTLTRTETQMDMGGPPAGIGPDNWSTRFTATLTPRTSGLSVFYFRADDGCRLYLDGKPIINSWYDSPASTYSASVTLNAGQKYELKAEYYQGIGGQEARLKWAEPGPNMYADAVELARKSDVVILMATTRGTEDEGHDRNSMDLPYNQDELIRRVTAANKRTIVVLNNGCPVTMPWLKDVPGLLEVWFPGQEGGAALSKILFGDVNPSGHLPTTFGARREDYSDFGNFPGKDGVVNYAEGIYVGYRAFDKKKIAPLFPFGHGLSYTIFKISGLKLSSKTMAAGGTLTATAQVTNIGKVAGAQVVQLYVSDLNSKADKAPRELKGFSKVMLAPGETKTVSLTLKPRDFAWCDVPGGGWRVDAGNYEIAVGDSSRNLTQKATVRVEGSLEPIPYMVDQSKTPDSAYGVDLALRGKATASDEEKPEHDAKSAFDASESTRWSSSGKEEAWIMVDLAKEQSVGRVHLHWETAYASGYRIDVSTDGQNWRTAYSTEKGLGEEEYLHFPAVKARYVRLVCTKKGTQYGNVSLYSFEVRAPNEDTAASGNKATT